ncbi:MAG: RNA methyltransferase [Treponema sp.]|nr:RNA methyltransferase [Treponema sp.]
MQLWYASVNFGLEAAAGETLKALGAGGMVLLEGALLFRARAAPETKCVNNVFAVLASFSSPSVVDAARRLTGERLRFPAIKGRTFRIIVMDCGKLRAIPGDIMGKIETMVARETGLAPNRAKPDVEIWLNRRNDGAVYFMLRLRKHQAFDKALRQGELRPDIVAAMIGMTKISAGAVVADPFGGSGAIAATLVEGGLCKKIYTGDINAGCVAFQKQLLNKAKNCVAQKWDALKLPLATGAIDAIITDPPWGEFKALDTTAFYDGFIREAKRVLRSGGALVFLSSAGEEAGKALDNYGFSHSRIPLKINGKNAFLFCAKLKAAKPSAEF